MELPLLDSPYVSSDISRVHGLLFGRVLSMLGVAWGVDRWEE